MPEKKTPRAPRPIRESTFLDDPTLYPEFRALTGKLPNLHAFRCGFHRHRTAVLALLVAVCTALSGVPRPPSGAAPADWIAFCASAMAIDRLKDHFEGFATSLAAMGVVAMLSIVVYPLHVFMTPKKAAAASDHLFARRLVTLGLPAATVWSFAVWVKSRYVWGLASALWFALFCACVTLKITSFTGTVSCAPEEEVSAVTPTLNGKPTAAATTAAAATDTAAGVDPASTGSLSRREEFSAHPLTLREYVFFLFQTPSLVCEVRLMKESARRRSRPLHAASEFFHATLAFLAAHCMVGALLAPAMRVFITGLRPQWVEGASAGWAELDGGVGGGGGWPSWEVGSGLLSEEGGKGPWVTLVSCLWMLTTVSSCVHFLVFYAFWHCVCLGISELWGFPDRHLYGCWWLIFDEPRDFLRMWSVPVHRWLSSCVHWPMLEAAARRSRASASEDVAATPVKAGNGRGTHTATGDGAGKGAGSGGGGVNAKPAAVPGWLAAVAATFVVSGVYHEAIVYVAMRGTCWPFNTFLLVVAGGLVTLWDLVFPLKAGRGNDHAVALAGEEKANGGADGGAEDVAATGNGKGVGVKMVRPYGARGMLSAAMFSVLVQLSAFICDCAAWLWWRHVLMRK